MGQQLKTEQELRLQNIENIQKIDSVNVNIFRGKAVMATTVEILAILLANNKLKGFDNLEDLEIMQSESDLTKTLTEIQEENQNVGLERILTIFDEKLLNPNVDRLTQLELLKIAQRMDYTVIIKTKEDLSNLLKHYNTPDFREDIFNLISEMLIEFTKDSCVSILANYFSDLNNLLLWEIIKEEQLRPKTERESLPSLSVFGN